MDQKFNLTKKASILGIFGNIFLLVIKAFIGFTSRSQAMIADSFNSAADIFASLMTYIGNKIASEPKDRSHNLGHGKAEYIFSLFISLSMIFIAIKLLYDSVFKFFTNETFTFSYLLVIIAIITIVVKLILYLYTRSIYKKYPSLLLKANMKDHKNDCFITLFTLLSILLALFEIYFVDIIVGIAISLWICYTGVKIFIESFNVLMDISIDSNTYDKINSIISENKLVKSVESITSTPVGDSHLVVITICVDGNMTTFESHTLADSLEESINILDNVYDTIIHVEPYLKSI